MNKKELIQNLRDAKEFVVEYDKIMAKVNKPPSDLGGCFTAILAAFLYLVLATPTSFLGVLLAVPIFIGGFFVYSIISLVLKDTRNSEYVEKIDELDQKFQLYIDIPIKYFNTEKIDGLISILESGLADTLKEALSVWQENENNKAQLELLKEQNKLIEEQIYASHQAAKAAKRAAKEAESIRNEYHHY
jgi:hypothetical protein